MRSANLSIETSPGSAATRHLGRSRHQPIALVPQRRCAFPLSRAHWRAARPAPARSASDRSAAPVPAGQLRQRTREPDKVQSRPVPLPCPVEALPCCQVDPVCRHSGRSVGGRGTSANCSAGRRRPARRSPSAASRLGQEAVADDVTPMRQSAPRGCAGRTVT
jgi:hypothetical protein